jgi:hypothetical protein
MSWTVIAILIHRSYEATVIGSIIQMPAWIQHMGYPDGIPEYVSALLLLVGLPLRSYMPWTA